MIDKELANRLEYHYRAFDKSKISPDPLEFPHKYSDSKDIETVAFISAVYAYGNVKNINSTLSCIFESIGEKPYNFLIKNDQNKFNGLNSLTYRFYNFSHSVVFFETLRIILDHYGALKNLFYKYYEPGSGSIKIALTGFCNELNTTARKYFPDSENKIVSHFFSSPLGGSTCKRMNLFLRWMVRKDELDFGLWDEVLTSELIIPVDTHIAKISQILNLTEMKTVNWGMAEDITKNLKQFDPVDPVKYDFALCHIRMRKLEF